jgi:hypothetical protein
MMMGEAAGPAAATAAAFRHPLTFVTLLPPKVTVELLGLAKCSIIVPGGCIITCVSDTYVSDEVLMQKNAVTIETQ